MVQGTKSTRNRIIGRIVAIAVGIAVIGGAVYMGGQEAEAASITLRGIEKLATAHSDGEHPFVVVEVVPSLSDARLGYLVGGEEPIDISAAKSIKDMPSNAERTHYMNAFETNVNPKPLEGVDGAYEFVSGYVEEDDAATSVDIRGEFVEDTDNGRYERHDETSNGDYNVYSNSLTDTERDDANADDSIVLYRKVKRYSLNKDGTESITLSVYPPDGTVSLPREIPEGSDTSEYTDQYFLRESRTYGDNIVEGDYLFEGDSSSITYVGYVKTVQTDSEGNVTGYLDNSDNPINDNGLSFWSLYNINQSVAEEEVGNGNVFYISDNTTGAACFEEETVYSPIHRGSEYGADNCPLGKRYYVSANNDYQDYDYDDDGTYDSDYNFKADYSKPAYESFKYNNGITNHEWFKKYVFDRSETEEYSELSIDVVTITIDQLGDWADRANLLYLAGGDYADSLDAATAVKINNRVATGELPVMMEYSTYSQNEVDANTSKLALLLMQSNVSSVADAAAFGALDAVDLAATMRKYNSSDTLIEAKTADASTDISYAYGRVFVNDDGIAGKIVDLDFSTEYTGDKLDGFAAVKAEIEKELSYIEMTVDPSLVSSFNQKISKATSIRYILNNSSSRTAVKNSLNILDIEPYQSDQYDFTEGKLGDVSANELNYGFVNPDNKRTDNTIAAFEYRDIITRDWVIENLDFPADKKDAVNIRQMGTKELVGINDDLNSTYDLIYIGMDTAIMNTGLVREGNDYKTTLIDGRQIKTKSFADTKYNNSNLNGLVYAHVGDTFNNYTSGEGSNKNPTAESNATHIASGNDITIDKLRELKDFVQAGYAVVLSDSFFNKDGSINTTTVDSSSNMYKFVNWVKNGDGSKYFGKNVMIKGNLEEAKSNPMYTTSERANLDYDINRKTMATYLNVSKLELTVKSQPIAYNDGTMLTPSADGVYYLDFDVELNNDSSIDTTESVTYDCRLYLDMDADGKYEERESLGGLMINNGSEVESDGKFHLRAGNSYKISRALPDEYVGFLSWKLEFVQNERTGDAFDANAIRKAVTGFSAVPFKDERPVIYVLQVTPNYPTNLDLKGSTDEKTTVLYDSEGNDLYKGVKDFKVMVHQERVSDYIKREGLEIPDRINQTFTGSFVGTHYEYLSNFDMVVFGFGDAYGFCIDEDTAYTYSLNTYGTFKNNKGESVYITRGQLYRQAILGIREYALSGRSMLFTHDLTSYRWNQESQQGYFTTHYLSDVMGFDRFGISEANGDTYSFETGKSLPEYEYKYDEVAESKGSSISDKRALNDMTIVAWSARRNPSDYLGLLARANTRDFGRTYGGEEVTAINEGQITQYPYLITSGTGGYGDNSTFPVNATHAQWYQLNLDSDSTDKNYNDDVVVWYAISNRGDNTSSRDHQYYKEVQNDARNNYYIYTKGNITYTGAGHSAVNDQEKKLFINTLVAAYNSGLHAPRVSYKENPWETSSTITSTYLPYDPELLESETDATEGGFLDTTITVNFKTMNNNFKTSTELLNTAYYVEVESGGNLVMNGKSYQRISPKSFKIIDASGAKVDWADSTKLTNYRIYQATFDIGDIKVGNASGKISKENAKIYIRIGLEELEDGDIGTEPGYESMNPLGIYALRLFELE